MKKLMIVLAGMMVSLSAYAGTAFFKYEINDSGMTKQCVYDHLGNTYTITIKSFQLCPLTIQVG